jgi:hypothetical protein
MAEIDLTKALKLEALKLLGTRIQKDYATKAALKDVSDKVSDLQKANGEPNVITGVKVNDTALDIAEKFVNILIATGTTNGTLSVNNVDIAVKGLAALAYKSNVSEAELADALKTTINSKVDSSYIGTIPTDATAQTVIAYIAEAVAAGVAGADHLKRKIVASTDAIDLSANDASQYIYMVTNSSKKTGDKYDEYMVVDGALEKVGDWSIDLSDYALANDLTNLKNLVGTLPSTTTKTTIVAYIDEVAGTKADKVTNAVDGNFAGLDANGNLTDSGKKPSDFSKVTASDTRGAIKVDGSDVTVVTFATTDEVNAVITEVFGEESDS